MSDNILRVCKQFVVAALIALSQLAAGPFAKASTAPALTGSYQVVQRTEAAGQEQLRVRIHLVNHSAAGWSVQRIMLWDFTRPEKHATRPCAMTLAARGSADTTQDFVIRRAEYQSWQRGTPPRLMLEVAGPGHARTRIMVRLDPIASQEVR